MVEHTREVEQNRCAKVAALSTIYKSRRAFCFGPNTSIKADLFGNYLFRLTMLFLMKITSGPLRSPISDLNQIETHWQAGKYEQALTELTTFLKEGERKKGHWRALLETTEDKHREWKADRLRSQLDGRAPSRELLEEIGEWVMQTVAQLREEFIPRPSPEGGFTFGSKPTSSVWDSLGRMLKRFTRKSTRSAPPAAAPGGFGEASVEPAAPAAPAPRPRPRKPTKKSERPRKSSPRPEEEASAAPDEIALSGSSFSTYAAYYDTCDWVDVSVYSQDRVLPGKRFLVTAFAHLAAQAEEVARLVQEADPEAVRQGGKTLSTAIERTTPIQFHLQIEDWEIDEPTQSVIWLGRPASVEFLVSVPAEASGTAFGKVIVMSDKGPVGRISFNLMIGESTSTPTPELAVTEVQVYRDTYLSYDEQDHAAIQALESHFELSGWKWSPAQPGPAEVDLDWEVATIPRIKKSELFVLFWSEAAEASERVETEWQVALGARLSDKDGLPDILAVNLQNPAPAAPERLSFLSFLPEFTAQLPPLPETPTFTEDDETLKRLCDEYVSVGDQRVFDILRGKASQDDQVEIIGLQNQFNTLRRSELLEEISADDARVRRSKINSSILSLVGRLF